MRKFRIYGLLIGLEQTQETWIPYYLSDDGKRRAADFAIPDRMGADELLTYLMDLFHERAAGRDSTAVELSSKGE